MTLGKKLTLSFAAVMALLLVLSWSALTAIGGMKRDFDVAVEKTTAKIILADAVHTAESNMLAWQRGMVLNYFIRNAAAAEAAKQHFLKASAVVSGSLDEIRPLLLAGV